MKNLVPAFVVALALTGAVASNTNSNSASTKRTITKTSAMPVPTCPPNDPNACGLGSN